MMIKMKIKNNNNSQIINNLYAINAVQINIPWKIAPKNLKTKELVEILNLLLVSFVDNKDILVI